MSYCIIMGHLKITLLMGCYGKRMMEWKPWEVCSVNCSAFQCLKGLSHHTQSQCEMSFKLTSYDHCEYYLFYILFYLFFSNFICERSIFRLHSTHFPISNLLYLLSSSFHFLIFLLSLLLSSSPLSSLNSTPIFLWGLYENILKEVTIVHIVITIFKLQVLFWVDFFYYN